MRYALVSDIHANLQAWNAVLLDIRSMGADQIICLGDIVGYGPNPGEVLQSVHSNVDHIILGNHDAVACGKMDSSEFYDEAQKIISWTATQLNSKAKDFLRSLPLTLAGASFRCAHGDFADPGAFNYIITPEEALPSWRAVPDQILFVGHTHEPAIHVLGESGTPHMIRPQDFVIETGKRYIVNTGSVGQPRDKDARASYCIYDTISNLVMWHRIPFDIDAFRAALHEAGISEAPSYFLRHDPRRGMPPIREIVSFAPAVSKDKAVRNTVEVQQLNTLKSRFRKWKILASAVLLAIAAVASFSGYSLWKFKNRGLFIFDPALTSINSTIYTSGTNMLLMPSVPAPARNGIPGWNIRLGDKTKQSIEFSAYENDGLVFTLSSSSRDDEINLISPVILAEPRRKMCFQALFKKSPSFSGNIAATVSVTRKISGKDELTRQFATKAPSQIRQGNWIMAKQTFDLPANTVSLRLDICGTFTGTVLIKDITLENKD